MRIADHPTGFAVVACVIQSTKPWKRTIYIAVSWRQLQPVPPLCKFVSGSDLMVAVPEYVFHAMVCTLQIHLLPMQLNLPPVPVILTWHQRFEGDKDQMSIEPRH